MGCVDNFKYKLCNNEYISKKLYDCVLECDNSVIPNAFNLNDYNNKVLNKLYSKNKDYFYNLYKNVDLNVHLDDSQIRAILADEDFSLIIAGAGSGKTTTMVAKIKYLIDKKGVDPKRILAMSYTKKSTEELRERIVYDFNENVDVMTFHSLGYKIIKNVFASHFPYVVSENERREIFLTWFKEIFKNKEKVKEIIENFIPEEAREKFLFSNYFKENYDRYSTFESYFDSYKNKKFNEALTSENGIEGAIKNIINRDLLSENIYTIKNELVKSKAEAIIANYLYMNNIDYTYEKVYEQILPDYSIYKPDFTLDIAGQTIYIEYFGLSNYKDKMNTYEKIKTMKENFHKKNHTLFIKIDYTPNEKIEETLKKELLKFGFKLVPKSKEEIYNTLLERNKIAELFNFEKLLYRIIDNIKSSLYRDNINEKVKKYLSIISENSKFDFDKYCTQLNYIYDFYKFYQNTLFEGPKYGFDFCDMLYYGKKNIHSVDKNLINYDYLIIDEYQDVSFERYSFALELSKINNLKLTAVGDDWQTIYSFAGSRIDYIINFKKYFKSSKTFVIDKTYRNSKEIVEDSSEFIMKNSKQIKKQLKSDKSIHNSIIFVEYSNDIVTVLKELLKEINEKKVKNKILLLSRKNSTIEELIKSGEFIDGLNNNIIMKSLPNINMGAMTIHKSKGLSADEVIIIDPYIPQIQGKEFWMIELFKNKEEAEPIEDAEERRILYVALTRTKNRVYIMDDISRKFSNNSKGTLIDELKKVVFNHRKAVIDKTTIMDEENRLKYNAIYEQDILSKEASDKFMKLKKWRKLKSIEEDKPAFVIFSNKVLVDIVSYDIKEKKDLLKINGIGNYKYDKYGDEIFDILMNK